MISSKLLLDILSTINNMSDLSRDEQLLSIMETKLNVAVETYVKKLEDAAKVINSENDSVIDKYYNNNMVTSDENLQYD